jgi:flagellar biosynthesis protein FliP
MSAGGVVEVFGSLLLVIGAIFALAWLARWLQGARMAKVGSIQIRGGAQLGAKEKVVLLQVGETQFLVGVASSSVSLLHRFESAVTDDPPAASAEPGFAEPTLPAVTATPVAGGGTEYSLSIQVLMLMTLLTLLPAALLSMTAFTRIVIVLGLLRQALGTGQTPTNQVLIGLSLFLAFFVMAPVFERVYSLAVQPYMAGELAFEPALQAAAEPMRAFMFAQTRETDLLSFARIAGDEPYASQQDVPFAVLAAAFLTSELTTAFQIGFLLFIPFVIIDLVVASVLMSMGMMMLSPMLISLPFKLMLFVLVDGWALITGMLAASFRAVGAA